MVVTPRGRFVLLPLHPYMEVEMRQCKKCGEIKPLEEFYRAPGNRDGRRNDCKECNIAAQAARRDDPARRRQAVEKAQEWRRKNPERARTYRLEYNQRPERKRA